MEIEIADLGITHVVAFDDFEDAEGDGSTTWGAARVEFVASVGDVDGLSNGYLVVLQVFEGHGTVLSLESCDGVVC